MVQPFRRVARLGTPKPGHVLYKAENTTFGMFGVRMANIRTPHRTGLSASPSVYMNNLEGTRNYFFLEFLHGIETTLT